MTSKLQAHTIVCHIRDWSPDTCTILDFAHILDVDEEVILALLAESQHMTIYPTDIAEKAIMRMSEADDWLDLQTISVLLAESHQIRQVVRDA